MKSHNSKWEKKKMHVLAMTIEAHTKRQLKRDFNNTSNRCLKIYIDYEESHNLLVRGEEVLD